MKEISDLELLAPGHRACAGCPCALSLRHALKALGKNVIISQATGCMEVTTTPYPETAWRVPWIHVAFENAAAVASGVSRALKVLGKTHVKSVAIAGDGGTADIGIQALSGAVERGEDILYLCYDNEAYMNTGIQRSGATPFGAWTTTTPVGKVKRGEDLPKKDMPAIMIAHGAPYVATASVAYPLDFQKKVKKAASIKGPTYVHVHAPCVPGWRIDSSKSIEVARLAVLTGAWILYEFEAGKINVTFKPAKRRPVAEYLKAQGRFRHLTEEEMARIQQMVDEQCQKFGIP
ncbi:MAG: pyruvate synthase subunit PorB [Candidatus Hadarchaeum sp.]|uniref:pyruvate synthase subunit PorB n=1 Tax=Candidatus Hadarchaeum sp. TaxID=2883567 RepID=UPI003D13A412